MDDFWSLAKAQAEKIKSVFTTPSKFDLFALGLPISSIIVYMYIVYLKKAKHGYMQVTLIADKFTPNTTADGAAGM